jgi:peptidoglycan hydrolase CwlO-like protein
MENQKLTEEEIKKIQELQGKRQNTVLELGNLETYQYDIDTRKEELHTVLDELRKSDQELGKELNEKYGDGSIDLEKGEFIPQEKA